MTFELQSGLSPSRCCDPQDAPPARPPRAGIMIKRRVFGHDRKQPQIAFVESNPAVAANSITNYESLLTVLRARANTLEIACSTIDHISGLQEGYSAKVLSPNELRRIGRMTLGPMLDALCLKLIAVPDDEAFARNRSRLVKRDVAHYASARRGHDGKAAKKLKRISGAITGRLFGWPAP
jgi:hypothetical protein